MKDYQGNVDLEDALLDDEEELETNLTNHLGTIAGPDRDPEGGRDEAAARAVRLAAESIRDSIAVGRDPVEEARRMADADPLLVVREKTRDPLLNGTEQTVIVIEDVVGTGVNARVHEGYAERPARVLLRSCGNVVAEWTPRNSAGDAR